MTPTASDSHSFSGAASISNAWLAPMAFLVTDVLVKSLNLSTSLYFSMQTLVTLGLQFLMSPNTFSWLRSQTNAYSEYIAYVLVAVCVLVIVRSLPKVFKGIRFWWRGLDFMPNTKIHLYYAKHMDKMYRYIEQNPSSFPLMKQEDIYRIRIEAL